MGTEVKSDVGKPVPPPAEIIQNSEKTEISDKPPMETSATPEYPKPVVTEETEKEVADLGNNSDSEGAKLENSSKGGEWDMFADQDNFGNVDVSMLLFHRMDFFSHLYYLNYFGIYLTTIISFKVEILFPCM